MNQIYKFRWYLLAVAVLVLAGFLVYQSDTLVEQALVGDTTNFSSDLVIEGSTPSLTVGDADAEDTTLLFDGNAQDFYVGLDDTADDLVVGLGSALGTTLAFAVDENQVTTWSGGQIALVETVIAVNTLTAAECGKTMFLSSATEFQTTLPAVTGTAGCEFMFIVVAAPADASYTIVTGNSLENVLAGHVVTSDLLSVANADSGTADDTITITNGIAVQGDQLYFVSDGTNWYWVGSSKIYNAIVATQAN